MIHDDQCCQAAAELQGYKQTCNCGQPRPLTPQEQSEMQQYGEIVRIKSKQR